MPNDSILLKTAKEEISKINNSQVPFNLWYSLARLYSASVLQISQHPQFDREITGFPDINLIRKMPQRLKPLQPEIDEYLKLTQFVIELPASTKKEVMSDAARYLVQLLGRPLFDRMKFLIETVYSSGPSGIPSDLFRVCLNGMHYFLMLSHMDYNEIDNSFADYLIDSLPDDGWDEKNAKLFPPLVRLMKCIDNTPYNTPNIFYLSKINEEVDKALSSFSVDQGLGLAAIPMHRDMVFKVEKIRETNGRQVKFRIKEPKTWPDGWEKALEEQILSCSENKIAIVALPELCGSPRVLEVVREALSKCDNNFPILLIAGSWHTDQNNDSFVNRLTVLSAFDFNEPILTHDKFEPFSVNETIEGNELGPRGLTFLVTSIGVIAFGICKDLFIGRTSGLDSVASNQINGAMPFLTICPVMTNNIRDLIDSASQLFKTVRSAMLVPNDCGVVRKVIRKGLCCKIIQTQKGKKQTSDVRSFISGPNNLYKMKNFENDESKIKSEHGVFIARSSCPGQNSDNSDQRYTNTVSVSLGIKRTA